jgi:hypothetical protein
LLEHKENDEIKRQRVIERKSQTKDRLPFIKSLVNFQKTIDYKQIKK